MSDFLEKLPSCIQSGSPLYQIRELSSLTERRRASVHERQHVGIFKEPIFEIYRLTQHIVFSGARAFALLTPEEQEFALNTTVTYAPQAYEYIRQCKASDDGVTVPTMGKEVPVEKLSEWAWDKVAEHPVSDFRIMEVKP
jgi:hypothetical protein